MITNFSWKTLAAILIAFFLLSSLFIWLFLCNRRNAYQENNERENKSQLYGELLPWQDASRLLPKYAQCTIIDFETGQQFKAQRRGGSSHADVQPLTASDTSIFKSIYGQWSWKRRAVLVKLDNGRLISASINGMPHGAGAIRGNNFKGHFCLHFLGSRTHASGSIDLAHQVMVWKAAGVFKEQMALQTPEETIKIFFTLLDQNDYKLAAQLISGETALEEKCRHMKNIKIDGLTCTDSNTYSLVLRITREGSDKSIKKKYEIIIVPDACWKIQSASLEELFADLDDRALIPQVPISNLVFKELYFQPINISQAIQFKAVHLAAKHFG